MIKTTITLDSDLLHKIQAQLEGFSGKGGAKRIAPATKNAFDMATKFIQKAWQDWAAGATELEGIGAISRPNSRLAQSIRSVHETDFSSLIYSESPYMRRIQEGTKELDMKTTHPYGKRSRVSKKNIPYLIIPFRWGTQNKQGGPRAHFGNTIPAIIAEYISSKQFKSSYTTGERHIEENYKGEPIERDEYNWGDRLKTEGNADGMVRMKDIIDNTYFTFRIISANSPANSWIRKAVPPIDVVGALEKTVKEKVEFLLEDGLKDDLSF